MMAMLQRQATAVLGLPPSARDERYTIIRESFYKTAIEMGKSEPEATEWGAKVEEWVRALVGIIESSGGARGGSA